MPMQCRRRYTNLRDKVDLVSMVSLQKSLKFEDTCVPLLMMTEGR
jgi:hypothetical protein